MPTHDIAPGRKSAILQVLLGGFLLVLLDKGPSVSSESETVHSLDIIFDHEAVAHVHALLELSAAPDTVFGVLTDYAHWPMLFAEGMTIVGIRPETDGVITEMYLPRAVLPGTIHLVIRTRITTSAQSAQIDAELVSGDLKRFWRRWQLTPLSAGHRTRADLEMVVQPKGWAPQWLCATGLRRN
jgi:ribosome-associated toxin RatA of RatAB toxin-antitoxin module